MQIEKVSSLDPASRGAAVTPADGADLSFPTRGILVGTAGNIKVDFVDSGTAVVLTGLLAGVIYPLAVRRIYSTGTTATNIVALW